MIFAPTVRPPPAELVQVLERRLPGIFAAFTARIDAALAELGVTVTSWWRDTPTNADVGGAQLSQHLLALALDVAGPAELLELAAQRLRAAGLVVVRESDHVHVQAFPAGIVRLILGVSSSSGG